MNYRIIFHTLGWVLNIEAASMLLPLICALIYNETCIWSFVISIILCLLFGIPLAVNSPEKKTMYSREGYVTVAMSWIVMSIFGSLPFILSGYIPNIADALFETVSGFTTTGASILKNVEALPKCLLFWRSFTHWIGGMGVLVFLVAILPISGGNNLYLIKAESTGPAVSKLVPKVRTTAKILYIMYFSMTLVEITLLLLGGMNLYEALTLSFGTAGTGGFAILNSSIGSYSPYVQNIITVFMILFGVDFSLYYILLLGKIKDVFKSEELRGYLGIIFAAIIIISINVFDIFGNIVDTVRHSAFQVGSIITTTGYTTCDYDLWPSLSKTILVALMFIGSCAGSTGGGIKVSRLIILVKSILKEINCAIHPNITRKITLNHRPVEHNVIRSVNVYMAAYVVIFAVSILFVSFDNFDFTTNVTAVAATINNIGPGLAGVGPTKSFADFSAFSKLVMIFDMLIGRLEILPFLVFINKSTWRK